MIVGVDVVNVGRQSVMGMVATNSATMTQHFNQVYFHGLEKEKVKNKEWTKNRQEIDISEKRLGIM